MPAAAAWAARAVSKSLRYPSTGKPSTILATSPAGVESTDSSARGGRKRQACIRLDILFQRGLQATLGAGWHRECTADRGAAL